MPFGFDDGFAHRVMRLKPIVAEPVAKPTKTLIQEPVAAERAPRGLANVKKAVCDFYTGDPKNRLDLDSLVLQYGNTYNIRAKSFGEVSGLTHLGEGCYSDVYAINDARVLKIVKENDSGYARFVAAVKAAKPNPHLPKIFYSGVWGGKTIYVLERLRDRNEVTGGYDIHNDFTAALYNGANRFMSFATPEFAALVELLDAQRARRHWR